jgi:hypothetical protein
MRLSSLKRLERKDAATSARPAPLFLHVEHQTIRTVTWDGKREIALRSVAACA